MPFNSLKYFLFLPVVYLLYRFAGERSRWCVLLASSLLFYAALEVPSLPVVLILVAATTYSFGIWLDRAETPRLKRTLLLIGVALNVLILVVVKYLPFFSGYTGALSSLLSIGTQPRSINTFVAIGVSYYVFQAISYLVDIFLEIEKPEQHFGYFALYLSFFPKLLQGPIERAGHLIPQLKTRYVFNYDNMRSGLLLFTWGLFKKVVIADRLGTYVETVYNNVHAFTGLPLLLTTYAYAIQIYMDFSGYTDMALGSALLFNINLTQNFNRPYLATSVADFWRRWHISFSRWILDYLFKPLQMLWRNLGDRGTACALLVAFVISGIWHGASWGFVIWGGMHGLYLASSVFYRPYQKKLHRALGLEKSRLLKAWQIFVTFHLVSFAWIFFRAANLHDAIYVITNMPGGTYGVRGFLSSQGRLSLAILFASLTVALTCNDVFYGKKHLNNAYVKYLLYAAVVLSCLDFGLSREAKFIYFGF
jgi:alginate O-acetyltransferase complex protein AlgI